jgi:REP element-mobilizing transposase RayT
MDKQLPSRQSIRKRGWDYTAPGWYFVTFNAHGGKALFGTLVNGRVVLSEAGRVAEEEWRKSALLRTAIVFDEHIIMPNHVHGLVRILGDGRDAPHGLDASSPYIPQFGRPVAGSLGAFVGAYKAAVSREMARRGLMHQARPPEMHQAPTVWHRNYWDVIVRDERARAAIRAYIRDNPKNYQAVMQGGEPRYLGEQSLLSRPKVGFLASRGLVSPHGELGLKAGEVILSGFLSPMERALFRSGLLHRKPMIWVKPWGLADSLAEPSVRRAVDEGRLLVVSPFDDTANVPAVRRAVWCNQYVLAHSDRVVIGHLNPDGMLACILSESAPDTELVYL